MGEVAFKAEETGLSGLSFTCVEVVDHYWSHSSEAGCEERENTAS